MPLAPQPPPPHGGAPVDLMAAPARVEELKAASRDWRSIDLGERALADVELLTTGAYAPLTGFHTAEEVASIERSMRLPDGTLWPLPITLDVDEATADGIAEGDDVALRDPEGTMVAVLHVTSIWRPDARAEATALLESTDPAHVEVRALLARTGAVRLGGPVEALELPARHDLTDLRRTPAEVRQRLGARGWSAVLALPLRGVPRQPLLARARRAVGELAATHGDAGILLHPPIGPGEPADLDRFVRARLARLTADHLGAEVELAATPLPVRTAGPREALLQAIVRQNHGATHLLVGPWAATPHERETSHPLSGPGAAQRLLAEVADELAITPLPIARQVWARTSRSADEEVRVVEDPAGTLSATGVACAVDEVPEGAEVVDLTEPELHDALALDQPVDPGLVHPDLVAELARSHPPRHRRGLTVFLTGLSGSGKSTVANVLRARLMEHGGRTVTLLDGDLVRRNLSSELGFSKEHRDLNVRRIGYVASEITKHRGIAICAPIAPYDRIRRANRADIEATGGGYVLVHISTPLEVCEARDRKGLYAKARAGLIPGFTGIDDPYEVPGDAALSIDTTDITAEQAADRIVAHLTDEGWWPPR
jgi:sulfate adenylyltransferase